MRFQLASLEDLLDLSEFVNRAYRGETARVGWTHEADLLDGTRVEVSLLAEEMSRGVEYVKMLNTLGQLVGCYHFEVLSPEMAYVGMITIEPRLQGQGLAKQLIADVIKRSQERGCLNLTLTVLSDRRELMAYYERRGFKLTGKKFAFEPGDSRYGIPKRSLEMWEMGLRIGSKSATE